MEDNVKIVEYRGIGLERGICVPFEKALAYAMERCQIAEASLPGDTWPEFCEMLVDWFYSGNWIAVEEAQAS